MNEMNEDWEYYEWENEYGRIGWIRECIWESRMNERSNMGEQNEWENRMNERIHMGEYRMNEDCE